MAVKAPAKEAAALLEKDANVGPFLPPGKPKMREWIQINLNRSDDHRQYKDVLEASIRFVRSQQEKKSL